MTTVTALPFCIEMTQCPKCEQWAMNSMFADRLILVDECCAIEHISIVCPYCAEITDLILYEAKEMTIEWSSQ